MSYTLGTQQLALLQIALVDSEGSTDTYGRFARAYELLFAMISDDGTSAAFVSETDLTGMSTNDLTNYYTSWKTTGLDSVDVSDWEKVDSGIDSGAWVFLRGVAKVNWGPDNPEGSEAAYSEFIREYSKLQFETRFGTAATEADIQDASDAIALFILRNILPDEGGTGEIPSIDDIAEDDAEAAVDGTGGDGLFDEGQVGGWAGNPFLIAVGHDDSYRQNILHDTNFDGDGAANTYDALSVIKTTLDIALANSWVFTTLEVAFDTLYGAIQDSYDPDEFDNVYAAAAAIIDDIYTDTDAFIDAAYGLDINLIAAAFNTNIILGTKNGDSGSDAIITQGIEIPGLLEDQDIVHAGTGSDVIFGSEGDDLIDGGRTDDGNGGDSDTDTLNYSGLSNFDSKGLTVDFETFTSLNNYFDHRIKVTDPSFFFVGGFTDYAFDIEKLVLTDANDTVVGNSSVSKDYVIEGGLGDDVLGDSAGDDVIKGGLGSDTVIAGTGENEWYGDEQPTLFDDRRNMDYDILDLSGLTGAITINGVNITTAAAETSTAVGFEEIVLTANADTVSESSGFATDAAYQEILYNFGNGDDTFKSGGEVTVTDTVSTSNKNVTMTGAANFEALGSNAYFNIQTLDHDITSSSGTTLDFTDHASSLVFDMDTYTVSDTSESLALGGSLSTASFIGSSNGDVFNLADGQNDKIFLGLGDDIVNEGLSAGTASSSQLIYYGGNDTFTGFAEHNITLGQNITQSEISFSEENVSITDEGTEKRYDFDLVLEFDGSNSITIENVSLLAGSGTDGIFGTSDDQVNMLNSDLPSIALAEGYSITFGGFEHYQFNAISPLLTNIGTVTDDTVVIADDSIYFARDGVDDVTTTYQYGGTVYGGLGGDTIRSGQTTGFAFIIQNTFFGGEGDDTLIGDYGQNALHGGAGKDTIQSNDSYEAVLDGGSGRDTLTTGTQGTHYLYGGSGNDIIEANAQSVDIYGGSGHDRISIGTTVSNATVFDFNNAEGDFLDLRGFQAVDSGNFSTTATATGFAVTLGSTNLSVSTGDGSSTPDNVIFYGDQLEEGTDGVDSIDGSTAPSRIFGSLFEGNDIFIGSDFADVVYGDEGDDDLSGGDGDDRIYGGAGDDVIDGGIGADFLSGGAGNDVLSSGTGDDSVLEGGDGNDQLYGDTGAQTLRGGDGNDFLIGYAGNDILLGGAGNDEMYVYTGNETFDGGEGIDTLLFTALPSAITVNLATGTATTDYGSATISNIESVWGTNLADTITGDDESNSLVGSKGADTIYGGGGDDVLYGDRFVGGYTPDSAVDTLYGGDGNDTLIGMLGDDILYGDAGDDLFYDYGGDETFDGGAGDADHLAFYYSADAVTIDVAAGTAIHSGGEVDTFQNIERFDGSAYADALTGGSGDDYLNGAGGDDTITGNGGANILNGSTGADTFVFTQDSMDAYLDTIADFSTGEGDALDVTDILSGYDPMTDLISDFIQMTDDGTDSFLAVDADGGADNFVQIATLLNATGLTDEADLETNGYLIAA